MNSETKVERTKKELLDELYTQIQFLTDECHQYDSGKINYSKKIALTLRILLNDTRNSTSLFKQLESKFLFNRPDFIDISIINKDFAESDKNNPNRAIESSFVRSSLSQYIGQINYDTPTVLNPIPLTINPNQKYPFRAFKSWWERLPIVLIDQTQKLTRQDAVRLIADQDGGAHIDPMMKNVLALLKREQAKSFKFYAPLPNGEHKLYIAKIDNILPASVRAIATETLYIANNKIIPTCEKYK